MHIHIEIINLCVYTYTYINLVTYMYINLIYFATVDRLTAARKFTESYFTVGEPNLILVSSGKMLTY